VARDFLSTYLNDHLAGAQAALEITARRAAAWAAEKLAELKMGIDDSSSQALLRRLELIRGWQSESMGRAQCGPHC
jgi:hypothetical protein